MGPSTSGCLPGHQGAQELRAEPRCGLLVGVGFDLVGGVGGLGERVEQRDVVVVDQLGDPVLAQGVEVGLLIGVVGLGIEHDVVRGVVQCPEIDFLIKL
ncbi:MAG: hypothetical protein ACRDRU_00265 [Pseudonocardiaceae bacterium]